MGSKFLDKLPDLQLAKGRASGKAFWNPSLSLALIQEKDSITAVVCEQAFFKIKTVAVFRKSLAQNLDETLTALYSDCLENGWAQAWSGRVKVCLSASKAIFQDFHLPPSSLRKAEKTIPLLLDSEILLGPDQYITRTTFSRNGGIDVLATLLPNSVMQEWSDALRSFDFQAMDILIMPWPLIKGLSRLKAPCLLFCLQASSGVICAINSKGLPLFIKPLLPGAEPEGGALNLARQAQLLMSSSRFRPESAFVFGAVNNAAMKKAINDIFSLPCHILGGNESPCGGKARNNEDSACLLARCMFSSLPFKFRTFPAFSHKFRREKTPRFSWHLPVVLCLALLCGLDLLTFVRIWDNSKKTDAMRSMLTEELRQSMENLPKNASLGRLTAILDSRLGEFEGKVNNGAKHPLTSMLENIHKVCPENLKIHLQRLSYDDKHIRLNGTADSYRDIEELKNGIDTVPGVAESRIVNATSSRAQNGQLVEFELDLSRDRQ